MGLTRLPYSYFNFYWHGDADLISLHLFMDIAALLQSTPQLSRVNLGLFRQDGIFDCITTSLVDFCMAQATAVSNHLFPSKP